MLTVEVADATGALLALQERVVAALVEAVGYEPDRRRFRPHVTVARVRRGAPRGGAGCRTRRRPRSRARR